MPPPVPLPGQGPGTARVPRQQRGHPAPGRAASLAGAQRLHGGEGSAEKGSACSQGRPAWRKRVGGKEGSAGPARPSPGDGDGRRGGSPTPSPAPPRHGSSDARAAAPGCAGGTGGLESHGARPDPGRAAGTGLGLGLAPPRSCLSHPLHPSEGPQTLASAWLGATRTGAGGGGVGSCGEGMAPTPSPARAGTSRQALVQGRPSCRGTCDTAGPSCPPCLPGIVRQPHTAHGAPARGGCRAGWRGPGAAGVR